MSKLTLIQALEADKAELELLVEDANKKLAVPTEVETAILGIMALRDRCEEALSNLKTAFEAEITKKYPDFKSLSTDNLRVVYRQYGGKYVVDAELAEKLPADLVKKTVKYSPVTKAVDKYAEENDGVLPQGISEAEREKKLSITLKGEKEEE